MDDSERKIKAMLSIVPISGGRAKAKGQGFSQESIDRIRPELWRGVTILIRVPPPESPIYYAEQGTLTVRVVPLPQAARARHPERVPPSADALTIPGRPRSG